MAKLGVNVDHVATLRQARKAEYPDPVIAARLALEEGASCITVHLREDRRHIQDSDVRRIRALPGCRLNLEMGATEEIIAIALDIKPDQVTLVPEKRQEITTEGGLDVAGQLALYQRVARRFTDAGIQVSLFIDPVIAQVNASAETSAYAIEINTGAYSEAKTEKTVIKSLREIENAVHAARALGLIVHAGHGLNYKNVGPIAALEGIEELNIGHSIVAHAVYSGIPSAVSTMMELMEKAMAQKQYGKVTA
ncbi:MAG: pyridoxine 5'-phosphate synthase [Nitrospinae bacterium]|nr:pyridoxine 5'-phosphate synthase [Nitrospinota bacterium]